MPLPVPAANPRIARLAVRAKSGSPSDTTDRRYRPDIDGLRAIAILSVVLYHGGLPRLTGGFTGVDIFFVISGYLIGGHIYAELRSGSFSYASFYRRAPNESCRRSSRSLSSRCLRLWCCFRRCRQRRWAAKPARRRSRAPIFCTGPPPTTSPAGATIRLVAHDLVVGRGGAVLRVHSCADAVADPDSTQLDATRRRRGVRAVFCICVDSGAAIP